MCYVKFLWFGSTYFDSSGVALILGGHTPINCPMDL